MSELTPEIATKLSAPIPKDQVQFVIVARDKPGDQGKKELWAPFIDRTQVQDRLDEAAGPGNWSFEIEPVLGSPEILIGRLTVLGVTKADIGDGKGADSPMKAAASDALKRCAVHFGIGRHLGIDNVWMDKGAGPPGSPRRPQQAKTTSKTTAQPPAAAGTKAPSAETKKAPPETTAPQAQNGQTWGTKLKGLQTDYGLTIGQINDILDIPGRDLTDDQQHAFGSYVKTLSVQHDWDREQVFKHLYERLHETVKRDEIPFE